MAFDTLILNGDIVDGTGAALFRADVGIADGRISAVGPLVQAQADRRIDATGHVVAPGFIDMHSHSDLTLLDDPGGESKAYQGVTTEVTGNCSYSPFPSGSAGRVALKAALGGTLLSTSEWNWDTLDGWADRLEANEISLNVAPRWTTGRSG